ncbi:hypothetical protein C8J56DRAFT_1125886 [Mycena floridula]|nr:hypothetical protein C8J56DRAFT_1125886 [Mycena floridula]
MTVIKDAGPASFGERWAADAGYASLIFDYRYLGDSEGQPRNLVSLDAQLEDYKSVLRYARQNSDIFRNDKIVVMASAVGSGRHKPCRSYGHCPLLDAYTTLMALPFNPRLVFWAMVDSLKGKLGLEPVFIRSIGHPQEFSSMPKRTT